nr:putative ribonuclease H-like domain-containing protein [Tanacetum cinerariifolium]
MDDESNQGRMIAKIDKDDAVVLMDEKEEEKKVEKVKIDKSAQVQGRQAKSQAEIYKIDMDHASKVLSMQKDELLGIKCSKAFPLLVMMIPLLVHFTTIRSNHSQRRVLVIFRIIQHYLQNKHYALWEVIEFGDSYKAPLEETGKGLTSESFAKKKGRTVAITTEDMQKRRNDVKARTTFLLALPDEHQLRFSKYETAKKLWEAILKTFGGNKATKKTKKNQLKLQYGNFKAEGSETLEQTFNRLQAIVSHLEFMDVEIKQDDLNQKFLTRLVPKWLIRKGEVPTASVPTASIQVSTASTDVAAASLSHDTIDKDDMEEMDIKWNMALLSMKAYRFWKKTGKKITIQGSDVAGFVKSKVECFNCHKIDHFAKECRAPRSQDRRKRESYKQGPKEEEHALKALMAIDDIGWDWSYMADEEENHALVANDEVPTEFALMAKSRSSSKNEEYDDSYCSKSCKKNTENLDTKISKLNKELSDCETDLYNYKRVPPPTQVYSPPKKDLSWTCLPEFIDDTVTDYSRPTPSIDASKYNTGDLQSSNFFISEHGESSGSIMSKPMIKFVKEADCPRVIKTNNTKNARKSTVKHVEMYKNISKSPKVRAKEKLLRPQLIGFRDLNKTLLKKDSGCSRHITGNLSYLSEYEPYNGGYVSFGHGGGKITGKGIIKTSKLEFENVYFVKELEYNLFSVSQICYNKNRVLFTDSECIVLGKDFKLKDDTNVLLKTPRQHNIYLIDLNNIVPHKNLTCLVAKDSIDERKFDAKGDEGYFVGYSQSSKAFKVFNKRTKKVEENLHADFLENKLIEKGAGPNWLFDIDTPTNLMNYVPVVVVGKSSTNTLGTKDVASQDVKKDVSSLICFALPNWFHKAHMETRNSNAPDGCNADDPESSRISNPTDQVEPTVSLTVESKIPTVSSPVPTICLDISPECLSDTFEVEADLSNMETSIPVSPTLTFKIHKDHPKSQIIGLVDTPVQTRHKSKVIEEQSFIATIHQKTILELLQFCLFLCFLSQEKPKKIFDALKDPSWVEAMQEELLQFKILNVWVLVKCPKGLRPIRTK